MISFFLKAVIFSYFTFVHHTYQAEEIFHTISVKSNDHKDYVSPIEQLIDKGEYIYTSGPKTLYAFRMPGLLPVYGPLYFIFGSAWAADLMVFLNVVFDALTVVLVGLISMKLFKDERYFYWAFGFYLSSGFVTVFNNYVGTESLSTFAITACLYLYLHYRNNNRFVTLFLSGLFLTWAVFLRPANVVFIGVFLFSFIGVFFIRQSFAERVSFFLKTSLVFFIPFILCEGAWIIRNYVTTKKIIPLVSLKDDYAPQEIALFSLVITWGDDIQKWNPDSWVKWFLPPDDKSYDKLYSQANPFDERIFNKDYNLDSLKSLRAIYWQSSDASAGKELQEKSTRLFVEKAGLYEASFKATAPISYRISSKLKQTKKYLLVRQVYGSPFSKTNLFCKLNKAYLLLIYYLIILGGILGMIMTVMNTHYRKTVAVVLSMALMHTLFHVYLGYIENRYLSNVFPIYTVFATYVFVRLYSKIKGPSNT